jgi:hypothetical protein
MMSILGFSCTILITWEGIAAYVTVPIYVSFFSFRFFSFSGTNTEQT